MAQRKLYEAEVEARNWEKRYSVSAFQEINQEFDLSDFNYTKQVDWQIRLKETRLVCMENWI